MLTRHCPLQFESRKVYKIEMDNYTSHHTMAIPGIYRRQSQRLSHLVLKLVYEVHLEERRHILDGHSNSSWDVCTSCNTGDGRDKKKDSCSCACQTVCLFDIKRPQGTTPNTSKNGTEAVPCYKLRFQVAVGGPAQHVTLFVVCQSLTL